MNHNTYNSFSNRAKAVRAIVLILSRPHLKLVNVRELFVTALTTWVHARLTKFTLQATG